MDTKALNKKLADIYGLSECDTEDYAIQIFNKLELLRNGNCSVSELYDEMLYTHIMLNTLSTANNCQTISNICNAITAYIES